jgi:hypothetical protein
MTREPHRMREQSPGDEGAVQALFRAVYPDDPDLWDRVSTPDVRATSSGSSSAPTTTTSPPSPSP